MSGCFRFSFLLIAVSSSAVTAATTGYVTTNAQTLSVYGPSISQETAAILAGLGAGQSVFSADGSALYVGEAAGMVIDVIDPGTNQLLRKIPVSVQVNSLAVSPDNRTLYYGGAGLPQVTAMDIVSGQIVGVIPVPSAFVVNCLALSPDGQTLYVSYGGPPPEGYMTCGSYQAQFTNPGGVLSASTSSFQVVRHFNTGGQPALALAVAPDGSALIIGSPLKITRFSTKTGKIQAAITMPSASPVSSLALTPDGAALVVAQLGGPVLLLNPTTLVREKENDGVKATNLAFSPDGSVCFFADNSTSPSELGVFSMASFGAPVERKVPLQIISLSVSPLTSDAYVTNTNNASFPFDADTGVVGSFLETSGYVPLVTTPSGNTAYAYAESPGIQIYRPGDPLPQARIPLSVSNPFASALYVTRDGATGFAALEQAGSFSDHVSIAVIDMAQGKVEKVIPFPPQLLNSSYFVGISPDGSVLYFQAQEPSAPAMLLFAWNLKTDVFAYAHFNQYGTSVLMSSDGKFVYVETTDGISKLDAATLVTLLSLPLEGASFIGNLASGPQGQKLYAATQGVSSQTDEFLEIDTASLTVDRSITGLPEVLHVGVTPDGSRAYLSTYGAPTMEVIDLTQFQLLAPITLPGNPGFISLPPPL